MLVLRNIKKNTCRKHLHLSIKMDNSGLEMVQSTSRSASVKAAPWLYLKVFSSSALRTVSFNCCQLYRQFFFRLKNKIVWFPVRKLTTFSPQPPGGAVVVVVVFHAFPTRIRSGAIVCRLLIQWPLNTMIIFISLNLMCRTTDIMHNWFIKKRVLNNK